MFVLFTKVSSGKLIKVIEFLGALQWVYNSFRKAKGSSLKHIELYLFCS